MTEPGQARRLAAADGKLYAVAVVALVYLLAWYEVSATPRPVATTEPRPRWLGQLAEAERPAVAPPPGWRVASEAERVAAPRVVRAPASRSLRVRTRSS